MKAGQAVLGGVIGTLFVGHGAQKLLGKFGGHGLGRTMHEDPHVANIGKAGRGMTLQPGLTLALEPWFTLGTERIKFDADGWTIRSFDGSRGAHSEHTIAVTDSAARVLTSPVH